MKTVHITPHSHWDREWYFTIEDSNGLLVEHLDFLINYLEQNEKFPHFVFDGQLSIVEEYLRYRPENEERLKKLITDKRIFIGPWYTQCDTFNPKIESVIRNLQYGINLGKKYGHVMNIGYLPDIFGQNAYLPSIFKNCGLDYSVLQRGVKNEDAKNGLNFNWVSPNGDEIKTNYIYFGYGPGKFLEADQKYLDEKLLPILNDLSKMSTDNNILLPSGGDQALIRTHFPKTIDEINKMQNEYNLKFSNYEEYMNQIDFSNLNKISGELYTPQKSRIHRTIHSQRVDIKILNYEVEKALVERLEPLVAICEGLNITYNQKLLDEIWKDLFDVHAHDSIGGCNSDATNQKIIARLKSLQNNIDGQINILKKKIAKISSDNKNVLQICSFDINKDKKVRCNVYSKTKSFELQYNGENINYKVVNFLEIDGGSKVEVTAKGERQVPLPPYYETEIEIELNLDFVGYLTFDILEIEQDKVFLKKELETNNFENDFLKVDFSDKITISSKENLEVVTLALEVQSDVGDSYDFSFKEDEIPSRYTNYSNLKIIETEIEYIASYMVEINFQNQPQLIKTVLTLHKEQNTLNVKHNIINNISNYRLRALFIKDIKSQNNFADSGFGIISRDNIHPDISTWKEKKYAEMPLSIYPFERFAGIDNLLVINSNVKEYEVLDDAFALTLIRTVELLGRDDLATRPGRASGINNVVVKTDDARLLNKQFTFEYNISLSNINNPYLIYNKINQNYETYQNQSLNLFSNRIDRFEMPTDLELAIPKDFKLFKINNMKNSLISNIRVGFSKKIECRVFNPLNLEEVLEFNKKVTKIDLSGNKQDNSGQIKLANNYQTFVIDKGE